MEYNPPIIQILPIKAFILFSFLSLSASIKPWEPTMADNFILENIGKFNGVSGEDINIKNVWENNITGKDVKIAFILCGCNPNSMLLRDNFDDTHSYNFNMNTAQVNFASIGSNNIGTGLVGHAVAKNTEDSKTGAAPDAKFSVVVISEPSKTLFEEILKQFEFEFTIDDIRVEYTPHCYVTKNTKDREFSAHCIIPEVDRHLSDAVKRGRNYKGTIYITNAPSMRNNNLINSYISNHAETIEVSASTNVGGSSFVNYPSPCTLINAPISGSMFNSSRATFPFVRSLSGWSSRYQIHNCHYNNQASTIAGVVALMLEVNPELGWRDVQWILLHTATKNDPESILWKTNAAGYDYHPLLGFGRVNAELACNISKEWKQLPRVRTISGSKAGAFYFSHVLEQPLVVSIDIEPDDPDMIFEFAYLTINLSFPNLNMLRVYVESPSGVVFQVISPAISEEHENQNVKALIRCFFGEKVKGKWKVIFCDASYVNPHPVTFVKLEISGIPNMIELPLIQKKSAKPISFSDKSSSSIHISAPDFAECGSNISITITYTGENELISDFAPVMLVNQITKRATLIGSCHVDGKPQQIYIPCLSLEREQTTRIMVELPEIMQRTFFDIILFNSKKNHEITVPDPYNVFSTETNIEIPFHVATHQYRLDSGMAESMFISLFDVDKKERIASWRRRARWDMSISIPKGTVVKNALLVATPTYVVNPSQCVSYIVPIHIASSHETLDSFIVRINTSCSIDPDILTKDPPISEKKGKFTKMLLDVFILISPIIAIIIILVAMLMTVWKIKTRRSPEDLESVYITT